MSVVCRAGRNWRAVSLVSVVTSRRRHKQKLEGCVTSVSCDLSVTLRQKLEGSVTSVSCDLSVTPPAETGGKCQCQL